ncbi:hypothetical protein ABIE50_000625 [Chitinophaga sp. OAE865]
MSDATIYRKTKTRGYSIIQLNNQFSEPLKNGPQEFQETKFNTCITLRVKISHSQANGSALRI